MLISIIKNWRGLTFASAPFSVYWVYFLLGNRGKKKTFESISKMEETKEKNIQHCGDGTCQKRDGGPGGGEEQKEISSL